MSTRMAPFGESLTKRVALLWVEVGHPSCTSRWKSGGD